LAQPQQRNLAPVNNSRQQPAFADTPTWLCHTQQGLWHLHAYTHNTTHSIASWLKPAARAIITVSPGRTKLGQSDLSAMIHTDTHHTHPPRSYSTLQATGCMPATSAPNAIPFKVLPHPEHATTRGTRQHLEHLFTPQPPCLWQPPCYSTAVQHVLREQPACQACSSNPPCAGECGTAHPAFPTSKNSKNNDCAHHNDVLHPTDSRCLTLRCVSLRP